MRGLTFVATSLVFVSSCSQEARLPEEPVQDLSGQELQDRLIDDLHEVERTGPKTFGEAVVEISEMDSAKEVRRRIDEQDKRAADQRARENAEDAERVRLIEEKIENERRLEQEELEMRVRSDYQNTESPPQ